MNFAEHGNWPAGAQALASAIQHRRRNDHTPKAFVNFEQKYDRWMAQLIRRRLIQIGNPATQRKANHRQKVHPALSHYK
jgi:hypothetical protein